MEASCFLSIFKLQFLQADRASKFAWEVALVAGIDNLCIYTGFNGQINPSNPILSTLQVQHSG